MRDGWVRSLANAARFGPAALCLAASACQLIGGFGDIVLGANEAGSDTGAGRDATHDAGRDATPDAGRDATRDATSDSRPVADAGGDAGSEPTPPSCAKAGPGTTNCGANADESCCTSPVVPGGQFYRSYDLLPGDGGVQLAPDGGPTFLTAPATVASFRLDKYDVTVGRFRRFVNAVSSSGWVPDAGAGIHRHLNDGGGLAAVGDAGATYEQGWNPSWDSPDSGVPVTEASLETCALPAYSTWTSPAGDETLPINCVTWWQAYAFCIWDGGFLPSEAEWEYAAAGGSMQRELPWGEAPAGTENNYAIYGCYYGVEDAGACTGLSNIAPVGSAPDGASRWGQVDMAGEVWNVTLDYWHAAYVTPCDNCANLEPSGERAFHGGDFTYAFPDSLVVPYHTGIDPGTPYIQVGFRCARTP